MKKRLINIEVVEENDQRVVVTINADGEVKRMPVTQQEAHAQATKALRKGVVGKTRPNAKEAMFIGKFDEELTYSQAHCSALWTHHSPSLRRPSPRWLQVMSGQSTTAAQSSRCRCCASLRIGRAQGLRPQQRFRLSTSLSPSGQDRLWAGGDLRSAANGERSLPEYQKRRGCWAAIRRCLPAFRRVERRDAVLIDSSTFNRGEA